LRGKKGGERKNTPGIASGREDPAIRGVKKKIVAVGEGKGRGVKQ